MTSRLTAPRKTTASQTKANWQFQALTVVDNYSQHSQLIEADITLPRTKVMMALERVANRSGYPQMITVDNGSKFTSKALDALSHEHRVKLYFILP